MDPKLNHLKKIFRSLLLPEKYGATIQHFRKLYVEMEGEEIPYRRFGFNTDIELLSTMNSVVHMVSGGHILTIKLNFNHQIGLLIRKATR